MMSRFMSEGQHDQRSGGKKPLLLQLVAGLIVGVVFSGVSIASWAEDSVGESQPVLQAVDISPLSGNRLQLRFRLSKALGKPPSSFTINEPARIVLDFLSTRNGLSTRQQKINVGVADRISVLEGADRTRASLSLARLVPYKIQVKGDSVLLTLEKAGASSKRAPISTPAGSARAAAASASKRSRRPVASPRRKVQDVGFRRGPDGQGVVTVKLSDPATPVDVRQEGNRIVADFQGARLPRGQQRRLEVVDFATPVTIVEALNRGKNARLRIQPTPPFEYLAYQADDLYVVEVRLPQKPKEEIDKEALFDMSKKRYTGDLLSLNFQDIEVKAILQILADFTGLNIVVSDSVAGNLTLRLQNVPWDQALDIILRTKGLTMRQNGNVIFIAPTEEIAAREKLELESRKTVAELIPLRTEVIQLNYAKAEDMVKVLQPDKGNNKSNNRNMLSPRGELNFYAPTNTVIVKDVPDKLAEVRALITQLDVPARQVMIDSKVVIASNDFTREIGAKFGVTGVSQSGDRINTVSGKLQGTNAIIDSAVENLIATGQPFPVAIPSLADRVGVSLPAAGPSIALAILGSDYLVDLELSALQVEGKGEVLSNPRVITADLKKATIVQGRQIPYTTISADGVKTEFKDAFLKLEVIPQITPDDRIRMELKVSKDEQGQLVPTSTGLQPTIDKREVETEVLVNNGETVVLGGVFEHNKTKTNDKVPLLGDIPLLGYLFQRNGSISTKRELLIFVTPQILKESALAER